MNENDLAFAKSAQLWFPRPIDMRNAFPYEDFKWSDIIIGLEDWFGARKKWLTLLVKKHVQEDPEWCAGMEMIDKKRKLWNDIYLEPDEDSWVQSFMDPVLIDFFKSEWEEELAEINDGEAQFVKQIETSLRRHHNNLLDAVAEWEMYKDSAAAAKHFIIFPENEELQIKFLHEDNSHVNSWLGKADGVYPKPKPIGKGKQGEFRDEFSFDEIPEDERTRRIAQDDPLNRDDTETNTGDCVDST